MQFQLRFTEQASNQLERLERNPTYGKQLKAVRKTLGYLASNPRHPSLHTHEFTTLSQEIGQKVFEAYAQNKTPGAYRVFWIYGPSKAAITIVSIEPHP